MSQDPEVAQIAQETRDGWAGKTVFAISADGGWWTVHWHTLEGVAPPSTYATPQEAAARLLQLMRTGPIEPQNWPERVCIGTVDHDDGEQP